MTEFGGQYLLLRELGAGGMGAVWLARDAALDREVAIKVVHRHLLDDTHAARFQQEIRLAARMQHPNIMTIHTVGSHEGSPFMVMEYLEGQDLEALASAGPLPSGEVAAIGLQICRALAFAHGRGVVHRDIKPANLFRCSSGVVKVTDFGIAKALDETSLTRTGALIGTPAYMSPQQWLGDPIGPHDDMWALGCALYRLVSGRLPYEYGSPREYLAAAARGQAAPDLRTVASVPDAFADAVMGMLHPDAAHRPTAQRCVDLLSPGGPDHDGRQPAHVGPPVPRAFRQNVTTRAPDQALAPQAPVPGSATYHPPLLQPGIPWPAAPPAGPPRPAVSRPSGPEDEERRFGRICGAAIGFLALVMFCSYAWLPWTRITGPSIGERGYGDILATSSIALLVMLVVTAVALVRLFASPTAGPRLVVLAATGTATACAVGVAYHLKPLTRLVNELPSDLKIAADLQILATVGLLVCYFTGSLMQFAAFAALNRRLVARAPATALFALVAVGEFALSTLWPWPAYAVLREFDVQQWAVNVLVATPVCGILILGHSYAAGRRARDSVDSP